MVFKILKSYLLYWFIFIFSDVYAMYFKSMFNVLPYTIFIYFQKWFVKSSIHMRTYLAFMNMKTIIIFICAIGLEWFAKSSFPHDLAFDIGGYKNDVHSHYVVVCPGYGFHDEVCMYCIIWVVASYCIR